ARMIGIGLVQLLAELLDVVGRVAVAFRFVSHVPGEKPVVTFEREIFLRGEGHAHHAGFVDRVDVPRFEAVADDGVEVLAPEVIQGRGSDFVSPYADREERLAVDLSNAGRVERDARLSPHSRGGYTGECDEGDDEGFHYVFMLTT